MNGKIHTENHHTPDLRVAEVNAHPFHHGSLFSGIGGFDLAAEWMGWENVFHCEWNEFGKKVLNYYWPNAISYDDITKTDFTIHRGNIDILTGGFPCQPYSQAGKRLGKEDERHLFPEMLRAIREIQPSWIVGENVRGLTTWNGGLVFNEVQADLEAEGYEVLPFLLPASGVNAPHERYRIWFVAYRTNSGVEGLRPEWKNSIHGFKTTSDATGDRRKWERQEIEIEKGLQQRLESAGKLAGRLEGLCNDGNATNAIGERLQRNERNRTHGKRNRKETHGSITKQAEIRTWNIWPTESPICRGNDGLSSKLDGITFPKWRNESIKAYGNAIVPQVVYQIFNAISVHEAEYGWR